jgi:thiol-disulfide isomerase/thioredoxin
MRPLVLAALVLSAVACGPKGPTAVEVRYLEAHEEGIQALKDKDYGRAEKAFAEQAALEPWDPTAEYNLACALALAGRKGQALEALGRAVDKGWEDAEHMLRDGDLLPLREDAAFLDLVGRVRTEAAAFEARWARVFDPARVEGKPFKCFADLEAHYRPLFRPLEEGEGRLSPRDRRAKLYALAAEEAAAIRRLNWGADPEAHAALIRLMDRHGNAGDAEDLGSLFGPFFAAFPDDRAAGELRWLYGRHLQERKHDPAAAREQFEAAAEAVPPGPWSGRALMELAESAQAGDRGDEALRYAERAIGGFMKDRELGFEVTERMRPIVLERKGLPPITAPDWDGRPVDLAAYKGRVLMIDFWATWCGPCVAEVPFVARAYKQYRERGFAVVGVSLDEKMSVEKLRKFCSAKGMTWPQVYEGKGWDAKTAGDYFVRGIPAVILVDRQGRVHRGERGEALVEQIGRLVGPS